MGGAVVVMVRRTYWHLEAGRRVPSEYEIVSSKLLYYPERGFEVRTPLDAWYRKYQRESFLRAPDWEEFRDPRETTYSSYTALAHKRETFVDGLFASIEGTEHDRALSPLALGLLARFVAPLCYPFHGLEMVAAYVGSMAPGGRLVMAAAFQAADEIRRVQRIAYRTRLLELSRPGFGADRRALWEKDPAWQPWRRVVERLLCTFDWGEALLALNLVFKPAFDRLFLVELGGLLEARGETVLKKAFGSLFEDGVWHHDWARAAVKTALTGGDTRPAVLAGRFDAWQAEVLGAVAASATAVEDAAESPGFGARTLASLETALAEERAALTRETGS